MVHQYSQSLLPDSSSLSKGWPSSTYLELAPYVVLVLTWWVFTPSALRLAVELLHARPRLAKALTKSVRLEGTIALLFSLFLVHSMACSTANAFDIVCRLDRNGTLDEAPQKKNRKLLLDYFLTESMNKTLLDPVPFEHL